MVFMQKNTYLGSVKGGKSAMQRPSLKMEKAVESKTKGRQSCL